MEFDKSRVYTAVNADEIKAGDKVIVAANLAELKEKVGGNSNSYEVAAIRDETHARRFTVYSDETNITCAKASYMFAYLVERAPEKKWRAYKDCDEMIADFKKRLIESEPNGTAGLPYSLMWHPMIWVKCDSTSFTAMITAFDNDSDAPQVYIGGYDTCSTKWLSLENLFERYTYLDGSPCGVDE